MSKKIIFSLLFVASLTSGCGFQLQTTNSLQKNYPQIKKFIDGKTIRKVIYVPKKLLNIVAN